MVKDLLPELTTFREGPLGNLRNELRFMLLVILAMTVQRSRLNNDLILSPLGNPLLLKLPNLRPDNHKSLNQVLPIDIVLIKILQSIIDKTERILLRFILGCQPDRLRDVLLFMLGESVLDSFCDIVMRACDVSEVE